MSPKFRNFLLAMVAGIVIGLMVKSLLGLL